MKTALITGASSGIGKDMAIYLNKLGYKVILVSNELEELKNVAQKLNEAVVYKCDLRNEKEIYQLYEKFKNENIDILINNAGFGLFGFFSETDLETELNMIKVNIVAVHILTKLFLIDFIKKDQGYILNVASSAGFLAGPYLNTYYATKNYVLKLTMAIYEELKQQKSKVSISALCPGPVTTNFMKIAGGNFNTKYATSEYVAKYGIDNTLKKKLIIIPTIKMKFLIFINRLLPYKLMLKITYYIQKRKTN